MPGTTTTQTRIFVATFACATFAALTAHAQSSRPTVSSISFASATTLPVLQVTPEFEPVVQVVRTGVDHLPEGTLLDAVVTLGQRQFRLTPDQVKTLTSHFKDVYANIAADPTFADVPSALPHAISLDPSRPGHYFLYRPLDLTPQTRTIVFLHGFGGNFHFYTWLLKREFPDAIIIAPSYGIAWTPNGRAYLLEVLADAQRRLNIPVSRPWLIALSAAGPAGFAFYNADPPHFRGLIALATCPDPAAVPLLRDDLNILMLNGLRDDRFPIAFVRRTIAPLRDRMRALELTEIDSDHFFLLTDSENTFDAIRKKISVDK